MKHILLSCLFGWLLAIPVSYAQRQNSASSAKLLLGKDEPEHGHRAYIAMAHRGITANITVPGRTIQHNWNSVTNRWAEGSIGMYTYDARGNATQVIFTDSATSQPNSKVLLTYNPRNQITESIHQTWSGSAYENVGRYELTYDAQGGRTLIINQEWNGTAWITRAGSRTTNTYNTANVLIGRVSEEFNTSNNTWELKDRSAYTVDASNQWTEMVRQTWKNGAYVNEQRIHNITWYNWDSRLTSYYENQEWSNGAWVDYQRSTTVYQSNGSLVEVVQELAAPNTWVNEERATFTYDNFGNITLNQRESWDNNAWAVASGFRKSLAYTAANQVRRAADQYYNPSLGRYVNIYLTTYDSFITLGTRRATGLEATTSLYPNPSSSVTLLNVPGLSSQGTVPAELLNMVGQVVRTFALQPQQGSIRQELNLEGLSAGIYTIRLHPTEGTIAKRIVKQ